LAVEHRTQRDRPRELHAAQRLNRLDHRSVMMVAMMVPPASPMILLFARVNRQRREGENPAIPTALFLAAYLVVWSGFSAVATLAQWGLHSAALLSPMMVSTSPILGGLLLVGAGVFQWTSLKRACLVRCRSPLAFLLTEWRDGPRGAFLMGLRHGVYCLGCCWTLMIVVFALGLGSVLWMLAGGMVMAVEKNVSWGRVLSAPLGGALIIAGVFASMASS